MTATTESLAPRQPTPKTQARSRVRGWRLFFLVIAAICVFGLLTLSSLALIVPYVIKHSAPTWVKEKTGRTLTVANASFNPFTLRLNVEKFALNDRSQVGAGRTLASLDALDIEGSWSSITNAAWTVNEIKLTQPTINAHIAADGSLDWTRFLDAFPKPEKEPPASDSIPRILLNNVSIAGGALRLTDERVGVSAPAQRRIELSPLTFKLDKLSTLPRDRGEYALDALLNDQTRVQWKGRVGGNPIESSGDLTISNLPLAKFSTLANLPLPVELAGTATLSANYTAAAGTDFVAAGIGGGTLQINGLSVTQNGDAAALKSLTVNPVSLSYARTQADAKSAPQTIFAIEPLKLAIDELSVKARGDKSSLISVKQLSTPSPVVIGRSDQKIVVPLIVVNELLAQLNRSRNGEVVLPFSQFNANTTTPPAPAAARDATAKSPSSSELPWQFSIGELSTERAKISFSDASFTTPQFTSATADLSLGATAVIGATPRFELVTTKSKISEFSIRDETAKAPWLSVKEIRAQPFSFTNNAATVQIPKIEIAGVDLAATLSNDGVDLAKKLSPAINAAGAANATSKKGQTANVSLAGVLLTGGRVVLTDATLAAPLTHTLQDVRIAFDRYAIDGASPLAANVSANLASGGALKGSLSYDVRKGGGEARLSLEQLALASFSPYINRNTKLKIDKGSAALNGALKIAASNSAEQSIRFDGSAALRDVNLVDETSNTSFAQWTELSTTDAKLSMGAKGTQINLADLLLDQPRGKIIIGEDRVVNLTQIGKVKASGEPVQPVERSAQAAPKPAEESKSIRAVVSRIQVTGGDIEFADLSLRPQFGTRVSDLSGLIVGLSTQSASRAEVSMEGKVDQFGLARLTGTIAPFGAAEFTDLKAVFRNLELANLTPYSGKFAGRKIESGKLSLDLDYKIEARKLKGENQVIIDNIKLGERVDSPDATNLPLDLAIAVMRDSNGVIDLGIPIQGSLDDPQFSYGSLIWKAIVNVLTKIATAPFRALGALLGGSGEEFEAVIFEPGEARLLPPEREKLAKLAAALEKRPQLKLVVEPRFDKAADRDALVDNIVKLEIGKRAGLKPPGPNEPLIISFTDTKVQNALDELAAGAGEDAVKLRAKYLPPAANAITGLFQNARERVTEKGRNEAAEARLKYYPELFALLKSKQSVPDFAYEALATLRGQAIANTITGVNKFDAARVSVAAPSAAKNVKVGQVPTQLALSTK